MDFEAFRAWLHDGLDYWATTIQAGAGLAAVLVAVVATRIARDARAAEQRQAEAAASALEIAKEANGQAVRADRARQREAQILAIRPMLLGKPGVSVSRERAVGYVRVAVPPTGPVLGVKVIVRQDATPEYADVHDIGAIDSDSAIHQRLDLTPFVDLQSSTEDTPNDYGGSTPGNVVTRGEPLELLLEWEGPLGQKVIESYTWYLSETQVPTGAQEWRLCRLQIVTTVEGADGFDRRYC